MSKHCEILCELKMFELLKNIILSRWMPFTHFGALVLSFYFNGDFNLDLLANIAINSSIVYC